MHDDSSHITIAARTPSAVVERTLLVARRQPTPLFEPIDTALHHIAPRVDRLTEDEWTPAPSRSLRSLVAALWVGAFDLSLPRQAATARITVPLVVDEVVGVLPWRCAFSSRATG
jgi:hypothetical protein